MRIIIDIKQIFGHTNVNNKLAVANIGKKNGR